MSNTNLMKIFCIGRNYKAHAEELGNTLPTSPIIFMKPSTALVTDKRQYYLPDWTEDLHYEVELVVKIKKKGKSIHPDYVKDYYDSIGLGIDFTARDIQQKCKENGHPWELAKSFDKSALIGSHWISVEEFKAGGSAFGLHKNGKEVQSSTSESMIFSINEILVYLSRFFTLHIGDLIYTGTPEGVGKIASGDILVGNINSIEIFNLAVK